MADPDTPGFYFERRAMGRWCPRWQADRPRTKKNDTVMITAGGETSIRALTPVEGYFSHLSLSQLREIYGPDGKLRRPRS